MTDEQLAQIKARADAATPGPWELVVRQDDETGEVEYYVEMGGVDGWGFPMDSYTLWFTDAKFIAHARTDIPALLAEVERLRRVVESQAQQLSWAVRDLGRAQPAQGSGD